MPDPAAPVESRRGALLVSSDPARLDAVAIHAFLTRSYWAEGIPLDIVRRAIAGSIAVGLYDGDAQVGFARAITDRATYAYLADVYVLESHRRRGLGHWMIETLLSHPALQGLRNISLITRDAHALYRPFGFREIEHAERYMVIRRPEIYKNDGRS